MRQHREQSFAVLASVVSFTVALIAVAPRTTLAQSCVTGFQDSSGNILTNGGSACQVATQSTCTFQLSLCVNEPGSPGGTCTGQTLKKKKIRATGHCGGVGKLNLKPNGTALVCQPSPASVRLHVKKNAKKPSTCRLRVSGNALTKVTLMCAPPSGTCPNTTTTTTLTGGTTTTTTFVPGVVVGSLPTMPGSFSYNMTPGLAGAEDACNTNFAGSHACRLSELQATPASALMGLKDTTAMTVTSFWAIDPAADPVTAQCCDDVNFHPCTSANNWEYGTAHTMSRGQKVPLNNSTGVIGALVTGVQCNFAPKNWVGCCK